MSITVQPKKRGRPATGRDPHMALRLPQAALGYVTEAARIEGVSRSELVRRIVLDWLKAKGYLKDAV